MGAASGEHPEPGMGWVKHAGVGSPAPPPPPCPFLWGMEWGLWAVGCRWDLCFWDPTGV